MKKILLYLFLSIIYLFADTITADEICQEKFDYIIKHGWSEQNQSLSDSIKKCQMYKVTEIEKNLEEPLKEAESNDSFNVPTLVLKRDDYLKLLAYVKFLESKGEVEEAYGIYKKAIVGMGSIKAKGYIYCVYKIVFEENIRKSLEESFRHDYYSKAQKESLKNLVAKNFMLDKKFIIKTVKAESKTMKDTLTLALLNESETEKEKRLMERVLFYTLKYQKEWEKQVIEVTENGTSFEALKLQHKKYEEEATSSWTVVKMFVSMGKFKVLSLTPFEPNYDEVAKHIAKVTTAVATPKIYAVHEDALQLIEENKKFVE